MDVGAGDYGDDAEVQVLEHEIREPLTLVSTYPIIPKPQSYCNAGSISRQNQNSRTGSELIDQVKGRMPGLRRQTSCYPTVVSGNF